MTFTPAKVPLNLWVGNHRPITWGFKTTDSGGATVPIDLSSAIVYFTVFNADTKLIELSTIAGTVVIGGTGDYQVSVLLTPAQTRTIAAATYDEGVSPIYELEVWIAGVQETWVYGKLKLLGGDNIDA